MLDELRQAATRHRQEHPLRQAVLGCKRLLSERGQTNSLAIAAALLPRLEALGSGAALDGFFTYLASELSPDPKAVLEVANAYAQQPDATRLVALTRAAEPPRQELLRRINRAPGGTARILRLRRQLLERLAARPELAAVEADLLHLLQSWFNPGFLNMQRVDWQSPAQLLEKIIRHEAVHEIDGWDDLRRRLLPDRRCFAFFHPQLPGEPLIFVEVALLPHVPDAIAALIDKAAEPLAPDRFRVAAFYGISNCEPGLRGVSLGNFLIKSVAEQLHRELPQLRTFVTLSPIPGLAAWLMARPQGPDFGALPQLRRPQVQALHAALALLHERTGGKLEALQQPAAHRQPDEALDAALLALASCYLGHVSTTPAGDPVARFHLDNGARLERINLRADLSPKGLRQSFGLMVNYLYDLDRIEASHEMFVHGEVARSRAVRALI
jgi:malonyl-CoA decarboxylase